VNVPDRIVRSDLRLAGLNGLEADVNIVHPHPKGGRLSLQGGEAPGNLIDLM
jgi:hypothetical protein